MENWVGIGVWIVLGALIALKGAAFAPACVRACPTDALVFGDIRNPNSRVAALSHSDRKYHLLEHLGTAPNGIYLKKIDPEAGDAQHA